MPSATSLPAALDALNDAVFYGQTITNAEREKVSRLLLSRQVPRGQLAGLIAPTRPELESGLRLYTGECLHTHLGPRNVCSAEIGRLCLLLGLASPHVRQALERLQRGLLGSCFAADLCTVGECAHSGIAFMRFLAAGGTPDAEVRLAAHLRLLADTRDGRGGWMQVPFHYTLLALLEIDLPAAVAEMRYAAAHHPQPLRAAGRLAQKYLARRQVLWQRLLARC